MDVLLNIGVLIVGFVFLIKGADFFVDGSAELARFFKVSGLIIGLTIVAMGTSAPELAVSVSAGLAGSNEIAVSNVVGSNIFNLLMVLGICAIMKPLPVDNDIKKRDYPISLIATIVVFLLAGNLILAGKSNNLKDIDIETVNAGTLFSWNGIVLIVLFILYLALTIYIAKKNPVEEQEEKPVILWKSIVFIVLGLAAIIAGGQMVVNSAQFLASAWGMSETLIGLTIIAIGTSLPELVTSVVASKKGQNSMAIGNVVGSNIFNLLLILGTSSTLYPIAITVASFFDLAILLLVSLIAYVFVLSGKKITRIEGIIMVAMYVVYVGYTIVR